MGHTLEKYKGCDVIDLNPGVCLWSQKLHDFLQPRTHVLVEPSPSLWHRYQRPLLDRPGSTYKLFEGEMTRETFDRLFESGILPHRDPVDPAEAKKPNDTILVTGALMWDPKAPGKGFDSLAKQMLAAWTKDAQSNMAFHRYGSVRSLLWMTEDDCKTAIPRSHYMYKKLSFTMNYLAKNIQVVTPAHAAKGAGNATLGARMPQYEIQSVIRAMRRGRENSMELPAHRRETIHDFADDIAKRNLEQGKDEDAPLSSKEMYPYLEKQFMAGKTTLGLDVGQNIEATRLKLIWRDNPSPFVRHNGKKLYKTKEGIRAELLWNLVKANHKKRCVAEELAIKMESVLDREYEILAMEDGSHKEAALEDLKIKNAEIEAVQKKIYLNICDPAALANERISLKSPVPRLQWDHRPYEPLIMHNDEVWPSKRVCLIDTEPYPLPPGQISQKSNEWVLDFAYALFMRPNVGVLKALDSLQPGASAIVDAAPSLRDPEKGGRLDLDKLVVSMLTNEMITELCQAYNDWPFKSRKATNAGHFQRKITSLGNDGPTRGATRE